MPDVWTFVTDRDHKLPEHMAGPVREDGPGWGCMCKTSSQGAACCSTGQYLPDLRGLDKFRITRLRMEGWGVRLADTLAKACIPAAQFKLKHSCR